MGFKKSGGAILAGEKGKKQDGQPWAGGIKSPQSIKPETVLQPRANFREIKGGGGKKSENGGKNAKSAAIRTKSGLLPPETPRGSGQPAPGAAGTR